VSRPRLPSLPPRLRSLLDRIVAADLTDRAGAVTYYGFLSLFPALIIAVALIGLVGSYPETYREIVATLHDAAPGPVVDTIDSALEDAVRTRGGAGGLLGLGLLLSLYSASGATGAAIRGIEAIYGRRHKGAWWHGWVLRFGLTVAVGTMLLVTFAAILLAGPLFGWISQHTGLSDTFNSTVAVARWPIGLGALLATAALLYWVGSGRRGGLRRLLPGALLAMIVTLIATLGFNFYVSNFDTFGATYGSLGAVIVLLIWMWINSLAMLVGAAVNAELDLSVPDVDGRPPEEFGGGRDAERPR